MDADAAKWVIGTSFAVICTLIGVIYWSLRTEVARLAKNLHQLRSDIAPMSLWLQVIKERLRIK